MFFSSTNIYLGLNTVLSISKCKAGNNIIGQKTQINALISQLGDSEKYAVFMQLPDLD